MRVIKRTKSCYAITCRHALSLIETIVVVGIVGILLSLGVVAIQAVRESSRRLACQNNLHQLGIALQNFVNTNHLFPSLLGNRSAKGHKAFEQTAFVCILPELESIAFAEPQNPNRSDSPENWVPPPVLQCPAGTEFLGYRFNFGTGLKPLSEANGLLRIKEGLSPAEILDGLSNTVAISERVSGNGELTRPVAIAKLPVDQTAVQFMANCRGILTAGSVYDDHGLDWRGYNFRDIVVDMYLTPNSSYWDCAALDRFQHYGARSLHRGGVNALLADGHVQWIASSLDQQVWQALGTVAGSEAAGN